MEHNEQKHFRIDVIERNGPDQNTWITISFTLKLNLSVDEVEMVNDE